MNEIKKSQLFRQRKYESSFKRKVISELLSGSITWSGLLRKYELSGSSLSRWQQWYKQDQQSLLSSQAMSENNPAKDQDSGQPSDIEMLREELRLAKLKLTCLETLIDVTEQELGIDIRKNAGTKSSEE
jgi:transposase-like protein